MSGLNGKFLRRLVSQTYNFLIVRLNFTYLGAFKYFLNNLIFQSQGFYLCFLLSIAVVVFANLLWLLVSRRPTQSAQAIQAFKLLGSRGGICSRDARLASEAGTSMTNADGSCGGRFIVGIALLIG